MTHIEQLEKEYEELRKAILSCGDKEFLETPLSRWANPDDAYLPFGLMEWPGRELLDKDFSDLLAVRGVGLVKVENLVHLLHRTLRGALAAQTPHGERPSSEVELDLTAQTWETARLAVIRSGVGSEPLGRAAPTLLSLPQPLWEAPIWNYATLSLDELRSRKGFGNGKVNAICEVVQGLYACIRGTQNSGHLEISVKVRAVREVEKWIHGVLVAGGLPTDGDVVRECLEPLLFQIANDGGREVEQVARLRLGIGGTPKTLEELANHFEKTRERMRQRLALVSKIMKVRWPEGQYLFDDLCERVADQDDRDYLHALLATAFELFYPARRAARITQLRKLALNPDIEKPEANQGQGLKERKRRGDGGPGAVDSGNSEYVHDAIHELINHED